MSEANANPMSLLQDRVRHGRHAVAGGMRVLWAQMDAGLWRPAQEQVFENFRHYHDDLRRIGFCFCIIVAAYG